VTILPASRKSDHLVPTLDAAERRAIFYLKTDILLPDSRLRGLRAEAVRALESRIPVIAEIAFRHGWRGQVVPIAAGTYHLVHRIVRDDGPALVVRNTLDSVFAEDSGLILESRVKAWLATAGHLVPEMHAIGLRQNGAPFDYAVFAAAPGTSLQCLGDGILDQQPGFLSALGAAMRKFHDVRAGGAGLLDCFSEVPQPFGVLSEWSDYILLNLDRHLSSCAGAGYIDEALEERIASLVRAMVPALKDRPMRLLHGDPGTHNVFVEPATGEVTAFLDWEDALAGDPLFDIALLSTFQPPRRMAAFMSGYGLDPNPDEQRLIAFYFLRIALSKTVHRLRFGIEDRPDRTPGHHRIYRGVDELERLC
jgi:hypothetical protein